MLDRVRRWAWTPEAMAARLESGEEIPFCDEKIRLEYPNLSEIRVKRSDLAIAGEKVLDLGGLHCHLIPMDTPHSPPHRARKWKMPFFTRSMQIMS